MRRLWVEFELFVDLRVKPLLCRGGMEWLYTLCPCCGFWRGFFLGGVLACLMLMTR